MSEQTLTRRTLLGTGGAAALSLALPAWAQAARRRRPGWLDRRSYAGRLGEAFTVRTSDGRRSTVRLFALDDLSGKSPSGARLEGREDAFLLVFRHRSGPALPQGTHLLSHRALGRARLFMVPGSASEYAIVVNRAR